MSSNENYVRYLVEGLKRYRVMPGRDLLALIPPERRRELLASLG
jgi:hypothetical protein